MDLKYVLKIFIVAFLFLSLILFINSIGISFNDPEITRELTQVVTLEAFEDGIPTNASKAFCDVHQGYTLEKSCNKLTKYNCGLTPCCVWMGDNGMGDNRCKAGNESGPTFYSDKKGKSQPVDYFYYLNKCYGEKCPNSNTEVV